MLICQNIRAISYKQSKIMQEPLELVFVIWILIEGLEIVGSH